MADRKNLTRRQVEFLEGYFLDIIHSRPDFFELSDDDAERVIGSSDFDDVEPAGPGKIATAKALRDRGLVENLDVHESMAGTKHIYLEFTHAGAEIMLPLMRAAHRNGSLQVS